MRNKFRFIGLMVALSMVMALILPIGALAAGPKNVIFFIGDGLANAQRRAAEEILEAKLVMNTFPVVGMYTTHCLDAIITDSAAAGTALATGHKTNSGVVSVDPTGKVAYETLCEAARRLGKSVGILSTTRITHATPASFGAHVLSRSQENDIAAQYLKQGFEVYMGGGLRHFIPKEMKGKRKDGRDLTKEFASVGYNVVKTKDELFSIPISKGTKVLGLFTNSHMQYQIDKPEEVPSLTEMTEIAIKVLKQNPNGFFLMVEGGRVDHGCHSNDPIATIFNTIELDNAVEKAVAFSKEDSDTLIFVGGDHETGGMGLGIGLDYFLKTEVIKNATKSHEWAGNTFKKNQDDPVAIMSTATGITDFTPEEIQSILFAAENVKAKNKFKNKYNSNWLAHVYGLIISKRAHMGWTSWAHTANPVMATFTGPGSEAFGGYYDNVAPARELASLWGITLKTWTVE